MKDEIKKQSDGRDPIDPQGVLGTETPIPRTKRDRLRDAFYGFLAGVALFALLYLVGVRPITWYRTTNPNINQPTVESLVPYETITIPLVIHAVRSDGSLGTERNVDDIPKLVMNAENIWAQAGIALSIREIKEVSSSDDTIIDMQYRPGAEIPKLPEYEDSALNVLLVRSLRGLNGVSYGGVRAVAIADKTAWYDFRVLAHELGHQFGLDHTDGDPLDLMAEDAEGTRITAEDIATARETATRFAGEEL